MANLLHYILRCIADGPVQLCDLLVKMQVHWYIFSDALYRVRYEEWSERTLLDAGVANGVGGKGDRWIEDEGFEDGRRKLEDFHRIWDREMHMDRPFPLFDGAPSPNLS